MDENKPRRRWLSFGIRDLLWASVMVGLAVLPMVYASQLPEPLRGPLAAIPGPNGSVSWCLFVVLWVGILLPIINRHLLAWLISIVAGAAWLAIGYWLSYTAAC